MDKIELIKKAKEAYYNTGEPIMSDQEYDLLVREVGETEVGAPVLDSMRKIDISDKPMLSLDKCHTVEEVKSFANGKDVVASVKCDGLSVRIIYENGKIVSANTRGDGEVGADITEHIKQFKNVPKTIDYAGRLIVDGEAIIFQNDFDEINAGGQFKNPRNLAAGTLASLDTSLCRTRELSFIAWDLIEGGETNSYGKNLSNLCSFGFTIVPFTFLALNIDRTNTLIIENAKEAGIPCDGVVWKFDDIEYGESLGRTAHHFLNGIAWKPAITEVETTLLDIEYDVSRTGQLTPVAVFEPVELLGSTVERASLHNLSIMEEMLGENPSEGQAIKIFKANEIIPQLSWADKEDIDWDRVIKLPTHCPICDGETEVKTSDSGVKILYCANPNCEGKLAQQIDHFVGKKGLDVKGLSRATIEKLLDAGWLNSRAEVFKLGERSKEWANMPGFGPKSVSNIIGAIDAARHCNFESYLSSLGIPLIGRTVSKVLAKRFGSYNEFRKAIREGFDFSSLDGFGYEMSRAIKNFDYAEADLIAEQYLVFEETKAAPASDTVKGMTFVITGKLSRKRDDIKADIEAAGGKVGSSVTGKTNYLVCNQPEDTTKYHAAEDKGIPIITEEQLMEMIK